MFSPPESHATLLLLFLTIAFLTQFPQYSSNTCQKIYVGTTCLCISFCCFVSKGFPEEFFYPNLPFPPYLGPAGYFLMVKFLTFVLLVVKAYPSPKPPEARMFPDPHESSLIPPLPRQDGRDFR